MHRQYVLVARTRIPKSGNIIIRDVRVAQRFIEFDVSVSEQEVLDRIVLNALSTIAEFDSRRNNKGGKFSLRKRLSIEHDSSLIMRDFGSATKCLRMYGNNQKAKRKGCLMESF